MQEDVLRDKNEGYSCFAFPGKNVNAHVAISPLHDEPIADFTVDMRLKFAKMTSDSFYLSVYSTRDNEFLIGNRGVFIAQKEYSIPSIKSAVKLGTYHRITVTRRGNQLQMYLDGKLKAEKSVTTFKIPKGASWILGQEQDKRGGSFMADQRFIGNICDFQMWNVGLTKAGAPDFFKNPLSIGKPALFDSPPSYKLELKGAIKP